VQVGQPRATTLFYYSAVLEESLCADGQSEKGERKRDHSFDTVSELPFSLRSSFILQSARGRSRVSRYD